MKTKITILVILAASFTAGYFLFTRQNTTDNRVRFEQIAESDYQLIAEDISKKIDSISPTPPAARDFTVTQVEFVKGENLAYILYNDSKNLFRILAEVQAMEDEPHYSVVATFDKTADGWKTNFGQDRGEGKETAIINMNR